MQKICNLFLRNSDQRRDSHDISHHSAKSQTLMNFLVQALPCWDQVTFT